MEFPEQLQASVVQGAQLSASSAGIFATAIVFYLLVRRALGMLEYRGKLPTPLVTTMRRIAFWLILIAAVLLVLQSLGVLRSVLGAVAGVLALISIGFVAVWSVLSNTLCSLILMIVRPFRVGDKLAFPPDDFCGTVVNFNMLFTTMETEDGLLLQVPNNLFFQRPIMRKKGKWHLGLGDQLYQSKNATAEAALRAQAEALAEQKAA